jgi:hypothetical protein
MVKRGYLLFRALTVAALSAGVLAAQAPRLSVSENGRFLQRADGTPFFYMGDTAWELFHRLNREEAEFYLRNRARKGFTVIQAVVLAEADGLDVANPYGELLSQEGIPQSRMKLTSATSITSWTGQPRMASS